MEAVSACPPAAGRFGRLARSLPDARLVKQLRSGDERAFEAIFDRYHGALLAFCRHMLGSREEAEDALQNVFVSAHAHLVGGDDRVVELRPWLYAIARNRCLSMLRGRRDALALDDVAEPSTAGLAVAAEVEQREDLREILGDLARLPDDQRAALVLAELGALTHDEVAAVLGVRRDKVKALVFQARESLAGWRQARDTDCREIRAQLANLRGGALRRGPLRKHLDTCDGCREFRGEVRRQREAMALLLPVVPSIALKAKIIGAVAASSGAGLPVAGTGVVGAGLAASAPAVGGSVVALGGGLAAKALVVAAIAGVAGGGYAVVRHDSGGRHDAPQAQPARGVAPAPSGSDSSAPGGPGSAANAAAKPAARKQARPDDGTGTAAKTDAATAAKGRPLIPGAQGFEHAPKSQGQAHRPAVVPSHGAKSQAQSKPTEAQGTRPATHPAKPAHPVQGSGSEGKEAPAKDTGASGKPVAPPVTSNRPELPPGRSAKQNPAAEAEVPSAIE